MAAQESALLMKVVTRSSSYSEEFLFTLSHCLHTAYNLGVTLANNNFNGYGPSFLYDVLFTFTLTQQPQVYADPHIELMFLGIYQSNCSIPPSRGG